MSPKKLVLVVDDEPELREILKEEFEYCGYSVVEAENGSKAAALLNQHPIDVVVSDIRMPGGSGLDLLSAINGREGSRPPVILVSAFVDINVAEAQQKGAFDLVSKPYDLNDVVLLLEKAVVESERREGLRLGSRASEDSQVNR
ncbi:MAG: response regulator [Proteobacteria bacterium]|nr:MAG: response regulator [Pseudomonadota bacterium]